MLLFRIDKGTGELTQKIHAIVSSGIHPETGLQGRVHGVDAASTMIKEAKKSNASDGFEYSVCDGHNLIPWLKENNLMGKFDRVFR